MEEQRMISHKVYKTYKKVRQTVSFLKRFYRDYEGRDMFARLKLFQKGFTQLVYGLPRTIAFEPISHCVLNCEFCMIQKLKTWKYRRKSMMSFDEFKKIIESFEELSHYTRRLK